MSLTTTVHMPQALRLARIAQGCRYDLDVWPVGCDALVVGQRAHDRNTCSGKLYTLTVMTPSEVFAELIRAGRCPSFARSRMSNNVLGW